MSTSGTGGYFSLPSSSEDVRRIALKAFYGCWAAAVAYIAFNSGGSFNSLVTSGGIPRGACKRLLSGPCAECAKEMGKFDSMPKEEKDLLNSMGDTPDESPPPPVSGSDEDRDTSEKSPRRKKYGCN